MKKKTNVIDNIIWVLRSIFRFDHKYIFAMGTVTVITAICSPMSTLVSQSLMNSLQERRSLKMLLVLAAIYIGIDLFQMLIECFLDYYKYTFAQEYNLHLNQEVLKKSSRLNLKSFESSETYDMVSRAQYEADGKLLTYLDSLMGVFSSIITTVSYLLIIVRFRIWIMLCILIIPIVKFCINRKMNRETFKVIRERTNDSRKCWYMQHVLTYGEAYKELKIYNLFSHFIGRYREYKKQFNAEDLRLKKKSTVRLGGATVLETMIDVNFRDDNENGARAKNAELRRAKISDATFDILMFYIEDYKELIIGQEYLFINVSGDYVGKPFKGSGVYAMLRRLERKTGIKASPHMLRHYFANARRKDGWKLEMISQALGHRNIETTMKYLNITEDELIEVSDAFYNRHQAMYGVQNLL